MEGQREVGGANSMVMSGFRGRKVLVGTPVVDGINLMDSETSCLAL